MAERKAFLLRLDPAVWAGLERLAQAQLRSVNAQIEFLLRDALARRGIKPKPEDPEPVPGSNPVPVRR
jgi:hypothetical protein